MIAAAAVLTIDPPEMDWQLYNPNPLHRSEVLVARRMIEINRDRTFNQFFIARLAVIPFALLGTAVCFFLSRSLFGDSSGVMAAALWAFSPTVLGYGSVITPDLASGVIAPVLGFAVYRWLVSPRWPEALVMSVVMATAMLIKSIWIFAPLAVLLGWGGYQLAQYKQWNFKQMGHALLQVGGIVVVSLFLVNAFYGFSGSFQKLGDYRFISTALSGVEVCEDCPGKELGNRFGETALANVPVPLPKPYLLGIDIQRNDFEQGLTSEAWMSYLDGKWQVGGWWYYYLAGLFYKETLLLWGLVVCGTVAFCVVRPRVYAPTLLYSLFIPAAMVLFVVCVNTGLNRYVRYVIPVLPFLVIWASQSTRLVPLAAQLFHKSVVSVKWERAGALSIASAALLLSLWVAPHWLSYFNVASGGLSQGYKHLCDCNVDWGQDLPAIEKWLQRNPEAKDQLHMAFFGSYDPVNLGIQYKKPIYLSGEGATRQELLAMARKLVPGWYVISKNYVLGHPMPMPDGKSALIFSDTPLDALTYFQALTPIDEIGGSMFVYRITDGDVLALSKLVSSHYGSQYSPIGNPIQIQPVSSEKSP